jgi:hypothetical protein
MKLPQSLNGSTCMDLVGRWGIAPELAIRLMLTADNFRARTGAGLRIISGFRSSGEQAELDRAGRPAAADELSTHRTCPATGADVQPELAVTTSVKVLLGEAAMMSGLRWGGGGPRSDDGIPVDWNHLDLGPRAASRA